MILYYHHEHYDLIKSLTGFYERSFYCLKCRVGYDKRYRHSCANSCSLCRRAGNPCVLEAWIRCPHCNRTFPNGECFANHGRKEGPTARSVCETYSPCNACGKLLDLRRVNTHACGESFCKYCKKSMPVNHQCYMQPIRGKNKTARGYIFFDFETLSQAGDNAFGMVPNQCNVFRGCGDCLQYASATYRCTICGDNRGNYAFYGPDCAKQFGDFLFAPEHKGFVAVAHNGQGFDNQFLANYVFDQGIIPEMITNGLKIMCLEAVGVKVVDSLNYIPLPLRQFADTFSIRESKKGYFPYLFNTTANQSYVGPLPGLEYYDPDGLHPSEREDLIRWHESHDETYVFDLRKELFEYCASDVLVLRLGVAKFRQVFMESSGIDPFANAITIASACLRVFRGEFLRENTIAMIPIEGYTRDRQSNLALEWLYWTAHSNTSSIKHSRNGGEVRVGPYRIDGLDERGTLLEFNGCLFHGHECVGDRKLAFHGATMAERREKTLRKEAWLRASGYELVVIWECEWNALKKTDPAIAEFVRIPDLKTPLNPREALYGGRTNAMKLFHEAADGERILYADVISLYPYICKTGRFPLGHPVVYQGCEIPAGLKVLGLYKCKILPPRALYHPVLPYRWEKKLLFPLCRTCAEQRLQGPCLHSDDQRALSGTWVSVEIDAALREGYTMVEIYETWHWTDSTRYDARTKTGGLFAEYVNRYLKIKAEASGWPSWCVDQATKAAYLQNFAEHEGKPFVTGI